MLPSRRTFTGVFSSSAAVREAESRSAQDIHTLEVTPLGGGAEVGRSCHILRYRGKTIMMDCGVIPSFNGLKALPYLSEIDPKSVDIIIITHFHLDHAAALPYFTEKMSGFTGRIFATHPTVAVMKIVLSDYVRLSGGESVDGESLYSDEDIDSCLSKIEAVDLHSKLDVDGVTLSFYNAGHVLGAAMVLLEIAGVRVLYTGDYSCEDDRHLMAAEIPRHVNIDVLVAEATHGATVMETREARERLFTDAVQRIVRRGGRCLIPVFALGSSQELMLIINELWEANPDLQRVPVYYANRLASRGLEIYKTFVNYMNNRVQSVVFEDSDTVFRNPWDCKHVKFITSQSAFKDVGPAVVIASPGMLQHGFSRKLFDRWCEDERNGVILTGLSTEGSFTKDLEANPSEVVTLENRRVDRRITIERVSFSAHADRNQSLAFIDAVKAPSVILVHGSQTEMSGLHRTLSKSYDATPGFKAFMPQNGTTVALPYEDEVVVRLLGSLAAKRIAAGVKVSGVLVQRNHKHLLVAPAELPRYTEATTYNIRQKQYIPYRGTRDDLFELVYSMFADVTPAMFNSDFKQLSRVALEEMTDDKSIRHGLLVSSLALVHNPPDRVILTWDASPTADMMADALVSLIAHAELDPSRVRKALAATSHHVDHAHGIHDAADVETELQTAGLDASSLSAVNTVLQRENEMAVRRIARTLIKLVRQYGAKNIRAESDATAGRLKITVMVLLYPAFSLLAHVAYASKAENNKIDDVSVNKFDDVSVEVVGTLPPELLEYPRMVVDVITGIIESSSFGLQPLIHALPE